MGKAAKPRRVWLRRVVKVLVFLLVLFAVCRGALYLYAGKVVNDLHAKGWPITPEELDAWYPQPSKEQDAAPLYMEAFQEIARVGKILPASKPESYAKALELLLQAADLPGCRFPDKAPLSEMLSLDAANSYDWELGSATAFLALEAHTAAEAGDMTRAANAVRSKLALARACGLKPVFKDQDVFCSGTRNTVALLGDVLACGDIPEESLDALDKTMASMQGGDSLTRTYRLSMFLGQRMLDNHHVYVSRLTDRMGIRDDVLMLSAAFPLPWEEIMAYSLLLLGVFDVEKILAVRWMKRIEAIGEMPLAERTKALDNLDTDFQRFPGGLFAARVFVYLRHALYKDVFRENALLVGRTAIAVERYRRKNGTLPKELSALVPEFLRETPIDYLSGQPVLYKSFDDRKKTYTVSTGGRLDTVYARFAHGLSSLQVGKERHIHLREELRPEGW